MELRARSRRLAITSRSMVVSSGLAWPNADPAAANSEPATTIDTPTCRGILCPPCPPWVDFLESLAVTLQYNISGGQLGRPVGPTRASLWISVGAIAGALALHGAAVLALVMLANPQG